MWNGKVQRNAGPMSRRTRRRLMMQQRQSKPAPFLA
jgi:hypothetical protein